MQEGKRLVSTKVDVSGWAGWISETSHDMGNDQYTVTINMSSVISLLMLLIVCEPMVWWQLLGSAM